MRNIKFRVYDTVNKCFISDTSNFWINPSFTAMMEWRPKLDGCTVFDINDSLVFQQYTGLKDKNGVEIYEGDIADWCEDSYKDEQTKPATIVWHQQEGWQCVWYKEDGSESFRDPLYVYVNNNNFSVIGNIFEGLNHE